MTSIAKGGTPELTAVTMYGAQASSARVRVFDWLRHTKVTAEVSTYADTADMRPRRIVSSPVVVAHAEARLRVLARRRIDRPVVLSREASPLSRGGAERGLLRSGSRGVYDIDDAIYLGLSGVRRVYGKAERAVAGARAADVVIVGNDILADWAAAHATDVRVIPSCVEPSDYDRKDQWEVSSRPRLVWMGSRSTEQYLLSIAGSLRRVAATTGARLLIISAPRAQEHPALAGFTDRVAWSPASMRPGLREADVALAPLDDTPFSRGKCAYKLLQYGAAGLPIVGSPVGANARALSVLDGISVEAGASWEEAILEVLGESTERRQQRGVSGIKGVSLHYSFSAWEDRWRDALGLTVS
jgi:glycosyltransferase involved in cell wall biosynthesis